jgi:GNAT superfamily N-acetyltransferase
VTAPVTCRPAAAADLAAVCEVRVRTWQAAYRGLVPQPYLDAMSPAAEADRRRPSFPRPGEHVAEAGGRVVGWAAIGPYRDEHGDAPTPGCGEVGAIYVLPDWQGRGVGRALMGYALDDLRRQRLVPVLLWVLAGNAQACRFYERAGFRPDGATHDYEIGGVTLPEVRYRHEG